MATSVVYHFRRGGQDCALLFERVTAALFTVLLDFRAVALRRIYDACRAELVATNDAVPTSLEAVARREMVP